MVVFLFSAVNTGGDVGRRESDNNCLNNYIELLFGL